MGNCSIVLKNVIKEYPSSRGLRSLFVRDSNLKRVIDNISLTIGEGERIGIVGENGAGKSTLLRLIADIVTPTSGEIEVIGKTELILILGGMLRDELTGRQNILIDLELKGLSSSNPSKFVQEIIDFSELNDFIDMPVKTYSSGMKSRLAFSMLITLNPEILIIDEALSAGDIFFSQKAAKKINELICLGKILLLVSHSIGTITNLCNRCIWIDRGKIIMDGDVKAVTEKYQKFLETKKQIIFDRQYANLSLNLNSRYLIISELYLENFLHNKSSIFNFRDIIYLLISFKTNSINQLNCKLFILITTLDGINVIKIIKKFKFKMNISLRLDLSDFCLGNMSYILVAKVIDLKDSSVIAVKHCFFKIENSFSPYEHPVCWRPAQWSFSTLGEN